MTQNGDRDKKCSLNQMSYSQKAPERFHVQRNCVVDIINVDSVAVPLRALQRDLRQLNSMYRRLDL